MRHSFTKSYSLSTDAINNDVQMIFRADERTLHLATFAQAFENRLKLVCQFSIITVSKDL